MNGLFISFEGPDGSGKSTQMRLLNAHIHEKLGVKTIMTCEPGGTAIGSALRDIFKDSRWSNMHPLTELLILNAGRVQHVEEVIRPWLENGAVVLTDRYRDSTVAYQVFGRYRNDPAFAALEARTHRDYIGLDPDITYLCMLDFEIAKSRMNGRKRDRLDDESEEFFRRVHEGYRAIAAAHPERIVLIDASRSEQAVHAEIVKHFDQYIEKHPELLQRLKREK